jgi:LuxR family maltose regulon positive regulatory protein
VTGPLITTKFHAPARRPTSVPRPRLTQRLATGARLILIAAPAGFGKTSILTEWLATLDGDTAVAWVSLDERDDPENQFWAYVITALDRAVPGVGTTALDLLAAANPTEAALATLINDLDASAREIVLVLDDLHTIENPAIHAGLAFLVDGLPENVRLVIATRADPPLPLARLRALGGLLELRAADLRFTADEAAEYLNGSMGLGVGDDDVRALGERTEGWIAAIQLAALSLRGRDDAAAFIAGFAGDDRYVVDYLVEEVLQQQDDAARTFLLETSILSRLTGDLCDAVTGTTGGGGILESLDRANLFLVPLDDRREWYRYHHLFGEMLRARLLDERPERVADLHGRASEWLEQNGSPTEAIDHALDAGAFGRAAELILAAMRTMQQHRQEATLVQWFERLPPEAVRTTPGLSIGFAGVLLSSGRTDGVEALLKDAEDAVGGSTDGILDLRRGIALYRAAQALTQGDLGTASQQSATAVDLADDGSDIDRGSANGLRGLVLWALGDLVAAEQSWAVSLDSLYRAGHRSDMIGGSIAMADILLARGRLRDARDVYARGLEVAAETEPVRRGAADMHIGMAEVLREQGDLEGARRHLAAAEGLGEYAGMPQARHRRRMAAAGLARAEGDPAAAIALLDDAERLYTPDFFPEVRPIAAMRARLHLAAGRVADASEWARRRGVAADDELSYLREHDHITLARLLLATEQIDEASHLLARLLDAAQAGQRGGSVIELLVLTAVAQQRAGTADAALDTLRRAVALAEPEGYLAVFADEGEPMRRLLAALAKRDGTNAYLRRVQAAAGGAPRASTSGVIDPLSDRELDVLRLLGSDLGGPEIARELFISLNTLRTHTKNVYAKLSVTSRREAVRRGAELGLLAPR